jgi:hypothetical protein
VIFSLECELRGSVEEALGNAEWAVPVEEGQRPSAKFVKVVCSSSLREIHLKKQEN